MNRLYLENLNEHLHLNSIFRFCTDFHITDSKSGISAIVKAGSGSKVIPLLIETRIINTKGKSRILSSNLKQWLGDRNLSTEARILRLEEGYVKEGSTITVMGMLHRNEDNLMISQPPDFMCTGCLWHSFLLPVDFDGLILGGPIIDGQTTNTRRNPERALHQDSESMQMAALASDI
ncbi:hypothetical protein RJ641_015829 [Dillenia turbinata]|uniref:Uncharacterized protein n=1 Tax=Dillenia turbinata TaxID=194707 RepID=A0AAN8UQP5_9MAGN